MTAPQKFAIGSQEWAGLSKLVEEAGELVQALGKLLATDGDTNHWEGSDLAKRIGEEISDVGAAIDFFVFMNEVELPAKSVIAKRRSEKFSTYMQWHREQEYRP